tara:strand:+ start:434 stop:592 length:159 start_codon:yes stop_codon:yes gene_type:complete
MSHDVMLTLSFYFWVFVFGVILSIPSKSKTIVSIKPKVAPKPEVFCNDEKSA